MWRTDKVRYWRKKGRDTRQVENFALDIIPENRYSVDVYFKGSGVEIPRYLVTVIAEISAICGHWAYAWEGRRKMRLDKAGP